MLSELEHAVVQKFLNPEEDLSELEWYALQCIISRRTQDDSLPPIEMLKAAKNHSKLSPLGGLDMPAWFEWLAAHPPKRSTISPSETSNVANQNALQPAEQYIETLEISPLVRLTLL